MCWCWSRLAISKGLVMRNIIKTHQPCNLTVMLWNKMTLQKETARQLASRLAISYTYLMALASGKRPFAQANRKIFVSAAKYLGIPVAQAMLHGGALQPADFLVEATASDKISHVFGRMKNDPEWGGFTPELRVLEKTPKDVKILIGLLYERAAQTSELTSVIISDKSTEGE